MKKYGVKPSVILFFILLVFPTIGNGANNHFDTECGKPGVVFCRGYRTQNEINQDWYINGMIYPAGSEHAARYNPTLDGAILPIKWDKKIGALHNSFPSVGGDVWVQFEIYVDQGFYDFEFQSFDSMKFFRFFNWSKAGCVNEKITTMTWEDGNSNPDTIRFRGHCGLPEVIPKYHIPGDRWMRMTVRLNFQGKRFEAWAEDVLSSNVTKFVSMNVPEWITGIRVSGASPKLHSSKRGAGNEYHPDFFIGYRNVIVSKEPIGDLLGKASRPPSPPENLQIVAEK